MSTTTMCSRHWRSLCRSLRFYFSYSNEPTHAIDRKPPIVSADEAVCLIKSGDTVFISGAAATPIDLVEAMTVHGKEDNLENVNVCHMHTEGKAAYCAPDMAKHFRSNSFFMGGNVRKAVAEGRADNISIFLQDIPKLFTRKIIEPDVAMIHVSPPDSHGYCTFGTSVDCVRAGVMASKYIIAQINCRMPRTFGDTLIHESHFDAAIEVDKPLPESAPIKLTDVETKIGQIIAENLVKDEATLQMGIGSIPDAVLLALTNHKDLGIHSEMFSVGVMGLIKAGAVTNAKKKIHTGKMVGSFFIGNKEVYEWADDNPYLEMYRVDYVNSHETIRQQHRMTAINSAVEIDLTGQVCADSIGTRFFSGFGGQVDFIRGSAEAIDGQGMPIIAIGSVTKNGESKIVPLLQPGAGVVTSRAHIHYVVTEYGIASLFGKNMRQRAHELINVAHPDHREKLEKAAFERLKVMPSNC